MRNLYGVIFCCVLLSLAVVLDNAHAKKPQKSAEVSAISLDVLRVKACAVGQGCSTVGGPKQWNLFDLAEGKTDFANQVLMPAKTHELRLMLGSKSTITVDGQTYSLTVPSGQVSGLKLKGNKVFASASGFLKSIRLKFDPAKGLVVQAKKVKGKGKKDKDTLVYSYSLKPVIQVSAAEVTPMPENMAGVFVMPDESSKLKLGKDFLLSIPVGAVSAPVLIYAIKTIYVKEIKNDVTGELTEIPMLSNLFHIEPSGTQFSKPLLLTIGYIPDALNSAIPEYSLNILQDGLSVKTNINSVKNTASSEISHLSDYIVSQYHFADIKREDVNGEYCTKYDIEDGIKHYNCESFFTTDPQVDMIIIDREKVKDKYKLSILNDSSGATTGTFTTQTVKQFASNANALVAINGGEFYHPDEKINKAQDFYDKSMDGLLSTNTMIINGIVKKSDRTSYPEAYISFNGNNINFFNQKDFEGKFKAESGVSFEEAKAEYEKSTTTKIVNSEAALFNVIGRYKSILQGNYSPDDTDKGISNIEDSKRICKHYDDDTVPGSLDREYSAVGFGKDKIVFIASKRGEWNQKLDSISEVCDLFMTQSAINALPLDGGGSSQLIAKTKDGYKLINDSDQDTDDVRRVANAIGLISKESCPNGNGLYCGDGQLGRDKNTLYSCQDGKYQEQDQCTNGCENGKCISAPASCPYGTGLYCGDGQLDRDKNTLYYCEDGEYDVRERCTNGCQVMDPGENDKCKSEQTTCPYGTGLYCGKSSLGQNEDTLYYCEDGEYDVHEQCSNGCEEKPPYVNDVCK